MTREEKIAMARKLRDAGLSYAAVGERLGVTGPCVLKWLKPEWAREKARLSEARPERKAAKRAHEQNARAICACGNPMAAGSAYPSRPARHCQECRAGEEHKAVASRAQEIVSWWDEGLSLSEIARRLGWTTNHLGTEMNRLRERGYELPYRRTNKTPRFPDQVAA